MNKKQIYKNRLEEHSTFDYWDFLTDDDKRELRKDVKERVKKEAHTLLEGTNNKATYYSTGHSIILTSYNTDVVEIEDGEIKKLWYGYSAATMRHINAFLSLFGYPTLSKHEWIILG